MRKLLVRVINKSGVYANYIVLGAALASMEIHIKRTLFFVKSEVNSEKRALELTYITYDPDPENVREEIAKYIKSLGLEGEVILI